MRDCDRVQESERVSERDGERVREDLEWLVKAITGQPETSGKKRGRE